MNGARTATDFIQFAADLASPWEQVKTAQKLTLKGDQLWPNGFWKKMDDIEMA
jgi:hypothetical protein